MEVKADATDEAIIERLAHGPLHRFADWPNAQVPKVAIGIYAVWHGDEFIYVGMAGRSALSNLSARQTAGGVSGLRSRLRSHASGRRSGDQFCVYVADKLLAASGHPVSDQFVRDCVCQHLSYRYFAFQGLSADEQKTAYCLEQRIQAGSTSLGQPLLNPKKAPTKGE